MDTWFIIISSLCVAALIRSIIINRRNNKKMLLPGPSIMYNIFIQLTTHPLNWEGAVLINLKAKYGPLFTLSLAFQPFIFVGSHDLAHQILIKKGTIFSDRPKSLPMLNISSASYGHTWRLFRRNLASEMMHPERIKSYSWARKWVLHILIDRLQEQKKGEGIKVVDHFHYVVSCLMMAMCFGEKFDERQVNEIAKVQRDMLLIVGSGRFMTHNLFPRMSKILCRNWWKQFEKLLNNKEQLFIPIIKSRIESIRTTGRQSVAYVDTLVNLKLPKEANYNGNVRKLTHKEMVSLCSEFLNGGTYTTSTSLQWIMANLVKHPHIQNKLYDEIIEVVGQPYPLPPHGAEPVLINEENLKKMPYLKAVVLEGLRRHPPSHFGLPHKVTKEVEVQGYVIPQGATLNFLLGEMGLDPKVWDNPMEFKPERFFSNDKSNGVFDFDLSGSKEIKMMPFGAGRRICPAVDLALLHLEYFVANLIWYFYWTTPNGYHVDLAEKVEFTILMKNPLVAQISSRSSKRST
uniref:cytochrome P450 89A2-like n=1 Tax=Erigeron canadensis TaxID=72917 RepID=UPI001CB8EC18|nr:cytochrome P450 89A2-like [Erigeron canadensis]